MRLIDGDALYNQTAEWENRALNAVMKTMNDEDKTEWEKWSTILAERSAFKFDVADAPTVDAVTIEELEQLRDEMAKCDGGDSYLVYYGHEFRTDMGYAFDGIDMLIGCLKIKRERKGGDE